MDNRPEIYIPDNISLGNAEHRTLSGGVELWTMPADAEVVRVSFVFHAGSTRQRVPFSASATANLLSEGSENMTSLEISQLMDFYGSYFDASIDRDYAIITFCALGKFFGETMRIAREMLLYPAFDEKEIRTYCLKRKQKLFIERSKPAFQSRELFAQSLFGEEHPYGFSSQAENYDKLTRGDIVDFYERFYTASNCFVVCSGAIDDGVIAEIDSLVGGLRRSDLPVKDALPEPEPVRYAFRKNDGALQSAIRIGTLLFPRSHPHFIPMQVVATILGGYFGSRLVHNLREERGYTYGVFAGMVNFDSAGYLAIATEVASEVTDDAIEQIFAEVERLRTDLVAGEELAMVKNIMAGEVMRILDGPFGIADITIENIQNGTDNGYLNEFLSVVKSITPEQVRSTAEKYLAREHFTTVVVGAVEPEKKG